MKHLESKHEMQLIEGGIRSACFKAGKHFIAKEFVSRKMFEELYALSTKNLEKSCTCESMLYQEDGDNHQYIRYKVSILGSIGAHTYRCGFSITQPSGKHSASNKITTNVWVESIDWNTSIDEEFNNVEEQ